MRINEYCIGMIGRLSIRDKTDENDILRKYEGVDLSRQLTRYLFRQWDRQIQLYRVKLESPQIPPYNADDWADWSIIESLKPDEIS